MASYSYYIADGQLLTNDEGHMPLAKKQLPVIFFGDAVDWTLQFAPGTLETGQCIEIAVDVDWKFNPDSSEYTPSMASVKHVVTQEDEATQTIQATMPTRFERFQDVVNSSWQPKVGALQVTRHIYDDNFPVDTLLCESKAFCLPPVKDFGHPEMVLPEDIYYSKAEIDGIINNFRDEIEGDIADFNGTASTAIATMQATADTAIATMQATADTAIAEMAATASSAIEEMKAEGDARVAAAGTHAANARTWAEGQDSAVVILGGEHSAKEWARLAGVSQSGASASQAAAATSEQHAFTWAEGRDEDVAALSGLHSAKGWAELAGSSADGAAVSATAASNYMETAAAKATEAVRYATESLGYRNAAEVFASGAATQAGTAMAKAAEAALSATAASNYMSTASDQATAAANSAAAASSYMSTASAKASEAAQSSTAAAAYMSTASAKATDAANSANAASSYMSTASAKADSASLSASQAGTSENHAHVWAEGSDSAVSDLGGTHAAKTWAGLSSASAAAASTSAASAANSATASYNYMSTASAQATAASGYMSTASEKASAASTSSANARTWAEGDDAAVAALGGEHSAKGWAESIGDKADRPATATAGDLASLTATRDLADSGIPASNVAQQDGYYGAKGLGAATAENLIDVHATGVPRMFTLDTAAGEESIAGDGNGRIEEIRGVTNTFNQMVAADNINSVSGTGVVQVSDAVAGNVTALEVTGRTYARNQRIVNGNFASTDNWTPNLFTLSAASNVLTGTVTSVNASMYVLTYLDTPILAGRTALLRFDIKLPAAVPGNTQVSVQFKSEVGGTNWGARGPSVNASNTWATVVLKLTALENDVRGLVIYPGYYSSSSWQVGDTFKLRNVMLADLTQCFGGDSTAIAAVSTWDDLVARIPEYASYVATDAGTLINRSGTVTGCGKNLVNQSVWQIVTEVGGQPRYGYNWIRVKGGDSLHIKFTPGETFFNYIYMLYKDAGLGAESAISAVSNLEDGYITTSTLKRNDFTITFNAGMDGWFTIYQATRATPEGQVVTNAYLQNLQVEYGSTATDYEPYHSAGSASFSGLRGIGTALDTQELVTGERTRKTGTLHLDGSEGWATYGTTVGWRGFFMTSYLPQSGNRQAYINTSPFVLSNGTTGTTNARVQLWIGASSKSLYLAWPDTYTLPAELSSWYDADTDTLDVAAFKTWLGSNPIDVAYALPTAATETATPQPLTTVAGLNAFYESAPTITGTPLALRYTGTDYSIPTISGQKYLSRVNGVESVVNGGSPIAVRGGRDRLINLTRWCGAGLEPSTADAFYALYPWARGYDMPYNQGVLRGYEGTGIETVGLNQLNINYTSVYDTAQSVLGNIPFAEGMVVQGATVNGYVDPSIIPSFSVGEDSFTVTTSSSSNAQWYGLGYVIRCIEGMEYTFSKESSVGSISIGWYDITNQNISFSHLVSSGSYIGHATAPTGAYWLMALYRPNAVSTTVTFSKPMVHFTWTGYRDYGQSSYSYEPFWSQTRSLPVAQHFPDGMQGDGTTWDSLYPNKSVQNYAKVDMGTLVWSSGSTTAARQTWSAYVTGIKHMPDNDTPFHAFSTHFVAVSLNATWKPGMLSSDSLITDKIVICTKPNEYASAAQVKAALSGTYLWYQLAEPITTPIDPPWPATYKVADFGTEQSLPANGRTSLLTAPFRGIVAYSTDFVRELANLPKNYMSMDSFDEMAASLQQFADISVTPTWDASNGKYTFTFAHVANVTQLGTSGATLQPGKTYAATTSSDAQYVLPAIATANLSLDIVVQLAIGSTQPTDLFVDGNATAIPIVGTPTFTQGDTWIFVCSWIPALSRWIVLPINTQE